MSDMLHILEMLKQDRKTDDLEAVQIYKIEHDGMDVEDGKITEVANISMLNTLNKHPHFTGFIEEKVKTYKVLEVPELMQLHADDPANCQLRTFIGGNCPPLNTRLLDPIEFKFNPPLGSGPVPKSLPIYDSTTGDDEYKQPKQSRKSYKPIKLEKQPHGGYSLKWLLPSSSDSSDSSDKYKPPKKQRKPYTRKNKVASPVPLLVSATEASDVDEYKPPQKQQMSVLFKSYDDYIAEKKPRKPYPPRKNIAYDVDKKKPANKPRKPFTKRKKVETTTSANSGECVDDFYAFLDDPKGSPMEIENLNNSIDFLDGQNENSNNAFDFLNAPNAEPIVNSNNSSGFLDRSNAEPNANSNNSFEFLNGPNAEPIENSNNAADFLSESDVSLHANSFNTADFYTGSNADHSEDFYYPVDLPNEPIPYLDYAYCILAGPNAEPYANSNNSYDFLREPNAEPNANSNNAFGFLNGLNAEPSANSNDAFKFFDGPNAEPIANTNNACNFLNGLHAEKIAIKKSAFEILNGPNAGPIANTNSAFHFLELPNAEPNVTSNNASNFLNGPNAEPNANSNDAFGFFNEPIALPNANSNDAFDFGLFGAENSFGLSETIYNTATQSFDYVPPNIESLDSFAEILLNFNQY